MTLQREAIEFVVASIIVAVLQVLLEFDIRAVTDWTGYLGVLVGAAVRAGAGAGIAVLGARVAREMSGEEGTDGA